MNAGLKAKWVAALRSGEYLQCHRFLHAGGHYHCCLGVLEIVDRTMAYQNRGDGYTIARLEFGEHDATLVSMNDGKGGYHAHTFPEIADWIEDNL